MNKTLIFTLALISSYASSAEDAAPLSVCKLIARRYEFNGRIVEVRGKIVEGGHGIYLASAQECAHELVTRGVTWPNIINLEYPNNHSPDADSHAPFEADLKAFRVADANAERMGYRHGIDTEIATYVGLFMTYPDLDRRVSPRVPDALRLGFGPAGLGAPAQVLIRTIKDVVVIKGQPKLP
jgi:hypothetical protein